MNDYKELIADLRNPNKVLCVTFVDAEQKRVESVVANKAADAIEQLVSDYEILAKMYARVNEDLCVITKERDAAVADLKGLHNALEDGCCYACKNDIFDYDKSVCAGCALQDNWEWRGVQEDKNGKA